MFPNMFVLLVGPPGVGKTEAIREVYTFKEALPSLHLAPSDVSSASLIDCIFDAKRTILRPADLQPITEFNSLFVASDEFGVFLKQYESTFMSKLNKFFDGTPFSERKRGNKLDIKIQSPLLSLLAGTTPAWLGASLPETAWNEGFASRLILIYSGDLVKIDIFTARPKAKVHREELEQDLQEIHNLYGEMRITAEAVSMIQSWYNDGCKPIPEHQRLADYLPRRLVHFLKLCLCVSASRSSSMIITIEDCREAMSILLQAEAFMPDVFRAMRVVGTDSNVMDETFNFIYTAYAKEGKAIMEHRIVVFLSQRVPSNNVMRVIETMISGKMLVVDSIGGNGSRTLRPAPRADWTQ